MLASQPCLNAIRENKSMEEAFLTSTTQNSDIIPNFQMPICAKKISLFTISFQGVHRVTDEITAKVSEKSDLFPAFWAEKIIFQPYHEIPAFENMAQLLSQSIE